MFSSRCYHGQTARKERGVKGFGRFLDVTIQRMGLLALLMIGTIMSSALARLGREGILVDGRTPDECIV